MSYTPAGHGALLAAYIKSQVPAGQSVRAFCLEHGLDNSRLTAWETAANVDIDSMRRVAGALGLTLGQVLVAAGYGTPDDFGGAEPPAPPPAPAVDDAIERDPQLTDAEREVLRGVRSFMRAGAAAQSMTVRRRRGK